MRHLFLSAVSLLTLGLGMVQAAAQEDTMPVLSPASNGPLAGNPHPLTIDAGPVGEIYVTGVVSGLGQWVGNPVAGDHRTTGDLANAQIFLNKTEGFFQFFVQAGTYSIPSLGTPYLKAVDSLDTYFGPVPQAYIKLAPTDDFSVMVGKLPTLVGAEYAFTFQNRNITGGLLWNQEPAVSRGVQLNYATGPLSLSVSFNDGFYSERFSTLVGLLSYAVDDANTLSLGASTSLDETLYSTSATPLLLNNQDIFNLIHTYTSGPLTVQTHLQYSHVAGSPQLGLGQAGSTYGAMVAVAYAFTEQFSMPVRAEYIVSTGDGAAGAPNLLYGPGSDAWSVTVTPTVQIGRAFGRVEGSFVKALKTTPGAAFGDLGTKTSQARLMAEIGVIF